MSCCRLPRACFRSTGEVVCWIGQYVDVQTRGNPQKHQSQESYPNMQRITEFKNHEAKGQTQVPPKGDVSYTRLLAVSDPTFALLMLPRVVIGDAKCIYSTCVFFGRACTGSEEDRPRRRFGVSHANVWQRIGHERSSEDDPLTYHVARFLLTLADKFQHSFFLLGKWDK